MDKGDYYEVDISKGYLMMVDKDQISLDLIEDNVWIVKETKDPKTCYAITNTKIGKRKQVKFYELLLITMGLFKEDGKKIKHLNGNKLDCRISNLKVI